MACIESAVLCFVAGDTVTIDWRYTENDVLIPIDLTGATAEMQLLTSMTDDSFVKVMTGGITDAANGIGKFTLTKVESQALLPIVDGTNKDISFVSVIRVTFPDTTVKTLVGVDVSFTQGGIR